MWALGLIAFYALTGLRYWRSANVEEASLTTLLREITLNPLDAATTRAAAYGSTGDLPSGFDAWFARCVAREPERRFANAGEAYAALAPLLGEAPVVIRASGAHGEASPRDATAHAPPPARTDTAAGAAYTNPSPKPVRRGGGRLLFGIIGTLVFLGSGFGVAYWQLRTRKEEPVPEPARKDPVAEATPVVSFKGAHAMIGSETGAVDERPVHDVSFPPYELEVREVTVAMYQRCVAAGACTPAHTEELCNARDPAAHADHPINCIDWSQASAYCAFVGRRLPIEEEWENAAAGGARRAYPWGNDWPPPGGQIRFGRGSALAGTCAVGSFPSSDTPEHLEDLAGNVEEWTDSRYCMYSDLACDEPRRVARGGGWFSDDPRIVRTTVRQGYKPTEWSKNLGVRCAKAF